MSKDRPRTPEQMVRELRDKLHLSAKRNRQRRGPGYSQHPARRLYGESGLYRLPTARPTAPAHA